MTTHTLAVACLALSLFISAGIASAELPFYDPFAPGGQPTQWLSPDGNTTLAVVSEPVAGIPPRPGGDGAIARLTCFEGGFLYITPPTRLEYYTVESWIWIKPEAVDTTEGIGLEFHYNQTIVPVNGRFRIQTSPAQSAHFQIVSGNIGDQQDWTMPPGSAKYVTPSAWHKVAVTLGFHSATITIDDMLWDLVEFQNHAQSNAGSLGLYHYGKNNVVNFIDDFRAYASSSSVADWAMY